MQSQFYALTIKEASTKRDATTKSELDEILFIIMQRFSLSHISPNKIKCFELDRPTKKYVNGRLHIHTLLSSTKYNYYNKLKYTDVKYANYGIVINLLIKPLDIARWAGYCQKDKIDKCDIVMRKTQTFKKDHNKRTHTFVPCILDFINPKSESFSD